MNAELPSSVESSSSADSSKPRPPKKRSRRVWAFRLAAVGFGLLLLGLAEVLCWGFDWGRPSHADDPFVGFREIHPLFEPDETGERYDIPPARLKFFAKESFPVKKGENTFRIFCLGGSTVQGRPWSKPTSFTTFLELALQEADPSRDWEVVNCGGVSYASYRLVPILKECLQYEPDLFILCTGHNEFLEDRTYGHIKNAPAVLRVSQKFFGGLRTFTLIREAVQKVRGNESDDRPELSGETEPILDYHDSLKAYHRDADWRAGVILHYESNLARMIAMSREAGVPMLVVLPPSNLGHSPPFKSEHKAGLTPEDRRRFDAFLQEARALYKTDLPEAVGKLKSAIAIDGQHAGAWYELGQCYRTLGLAAQAREALVRARDEDICPLRMLSPMEQALKETVRDTETPWLDAHALLEADCRQKILDGQWLIDHVHPTIPGYQRIADALVEKLEEQGFAQPAKDWQTRAHRVYEKHVDSLGRFYWERGVRTLDAVKGWTQGQAAGPPAAERFPRRLGREKKR